MSLLEISLALGGKLARSVDLGAGEVIYTDSPARKREDVGLSTCHISPRARVEWYSGASYLKAVSGRKRVGASGKGHKRGRITGFSVNSRRRLLRELSKIRRDRLPVMVTLTYPGQYAESPEIWKNDLDNFLRRLARRFEHASGVWKLEPQRRGAPHFHLLVWGASYHDLLQWVSAAWYEVVGSNDERHLRAGTRVEMVRSYSGVRSYAAKYLGKEVQGGCWQYPGRWWGIFQRVKLPYGDFVVACVSPAKAVEFIRYMRRFSHILGRDYPSLTITCNSDFWIVRLL